MPPPLTAATRRVLRDLKALGISLRALARAAAVPNTTLARIRRGALGASPVVTRKVAAALERWSARLGRHAAQLGAAAQRSRRPRNGRAA